MDILINISVFVEGVLFLSKRKYCLNENIINRRIKEGRGKGTLRDYKPWVTINDYPSKGRSTRIQGIKTGRLHHLMSDMEKYFFYLCEWDSNVIDIREKFPLDRGLTFEIAENLKIKHPTVDDGDEPSVITTDFLITYNDVTYVNRREMAIDIVSSKYLEDKRYIELLELQRRYWKSKDISFYIVTEKEIDLIVAKNIQWFHSYYFNIDESNFKDYETIIDCIVQAISDSDEIILDVLNRVDWELSLEEGTSLSIFRTLLAHKTISVDITKKITLKENCTEFKVSNKERLVS